MFKILQLKISIKAFHPYYINRFIIDSILELKKHHISNFKNIHLPRKIERFTLLRSPHVDKKARDQFERVTHKRLIQFNLPYTGEHTLQKVHHLINFLQKTAVGISIVYKYQIKN